MVTVAPETAAPVASTTCPRIVPWEFCAARGIGADSRERIRVELAMSPRQRLILFMKPSVDVRSPRRDCQKTLCWRTNLNKAFNRCQEENDRFCYIRSL